jgi:hypothetical protein
LKIKKDKNAKARKLIAKAVNKGLITRATAVKLIKEAKKTGKPLT